MKTLICPTPATKENVITLAHGSGGKQTNHLIEELFAPTFALSTLHDGALITLNNQKLVFTTDSYVIWPPFFPGGDIGTLAVTGTLNDLAMCGAKPHYISCGLIIEEGFSLSDLKTLITSMQSVAREQGVHIVTGDTKVIERKETSSIYINTSGIGSPLQESPIAPTQIQEGDAILLSGDIGRHGMAVMAERNGFTFTPPLTTDCAPLFPLVEALLAHGITVHCLRDLTRGGLATALVELCESAHHTFTIDHTSIPITAPVNSACEILGFDPLYVANEGRFVAFIPEKQTQEALAILHTFEIGTQATCIGTVLGKEPEVLLRNSLGTLRPLYRLSGDQLPRIC